MSQGDSPAHAVMRIIEAIALVIVEDSNQGLHPHDRRPASADGWELLASTQQHGTRFSAADVDLLATQSAAAVIAAVVYLENSGAQAAAPPPLMIATLGVDQPHF